MAATTTHVQALAVADDLTDEQMQEMLQQATIRLRAKAESQSLVKADHKPIYTFPKLDAGSLEKPYVTTKGQVAEVDAQRLLREKERSASLGAKKVEDPVKVKKTAAQKRKATAGKDWYDLPRTNLTPELKRDLQLLKMRNVLDTHRHYKKDGGKMKPPEYSQVGTIVEGPTEYFSGRLENKNRKRTFVEEVLAGEQDSGRFKRKYGDIQTKRTSGKKAHYKALQAKRKSGVKKGSG